MTINRISSLASQLAITDLDYNPTKKFISGTVIRFESAIIYEDLHALNNLASELKRGVYFES